MHAGSNTLLVISATLSCSWYPPGIVEPSGRLSCLQAALERCGKSSSNMGSVRMSLRVPSPATGGTGAGTGTGVGAGTGAGAGAGFSEPGAHCQYHSLWRIHAKLCELEERQYPQASSLLQRAVRRRSRVL